MAAFEVGNGRTRLIRNHELDGLRGTTFDVEWVPIATPDNPAANAPGNSVWRQGRTQNAATFARLEGCWYGNDARIYIVSTSGGSVSQGQIWIYDPAAETISLLFESPSPDVLNMPDNITVSPRGGLVLCECSRGVTRGTCPAGGAYVIRGARRDRADRSAVRPRCGESRLLRPSKSTRLPRPV